MDNRVKGTLNTTQPVLQDETPAKSIVKQGSTQRAPTSPKSTNATISKPPVITGWDKFKVGIKTFFENLGAGKGVSGLKADVKEKLAALNADRLERYEATSAKKLGLLSDVQVSLFSKKIESTRNQVAKDLGATLPDNSNLRGTAIDFFNENAARANPKIALSVGIDGLLKALAPLTGDAAKLELLEILEGSILHASNDVLQNLDVETLRDIAKEFAAEGRTEKAEIVNAFADKLEYAKSPQGSIELFEHLAKNVLEESVEKMSEVFKNSKSNNNFMRGAEATPFANVIMAHGLYDVVNQARDIHIGLRNVPEYSEMMKEINNLDRDAKEIASKKIPPEKDDRFANMRQIKDQNMTTGILEKVFKLGEAAIGSFGEIKPDPKVVSKLQEFSKEISDQVSEGKMTEAQAGEVMHQYYNNAVILRCLNPSITNNNNGNSVDEHVAFMVGDLVQMAANGTDLGLKSSSSDEVKKQFAQMRPELSNQLDEVLVKVYGMPEWARTEAWSGKTKAPVDPTFVAASKTPLPKETEEEITYLSGDKSPENKTETKLDEIE